MFQDWLGAVSRLADETRRTRESSGAVGSIGGLGNRQLDVGSKLDLCRDSLILGFPSV